MTGDTHYDLETLGDLAEGLLDAGTAARVREHLAVCDPCGESLADLAAVREVLAAMPVPAMPMGVALRVDKALAAESEARQARGGLQLAEAPDWDRMMAGAPWEVPATPVEPAVPQLPAAPAPEPVPRLGVVAGDGSITPARSRRPGRRRRWLAPLAAGVAAAGAIGVGGVTVNLLSATGTGAAPATVAQGQHPADVPGAAQRPPGGTERASAGRRYVIGKSGYNYSAAALKGPLNTYLGATPGSGNDASADPAVTRCVSQISARVGRRLNLQRSPNPIGVDRAQYRGKDATMMAFWKDRLHNAVWVYVVDDRCQNVRQPVVSRWQ
ncbi:hypothetical protein Sru01_54150 [Sphaerisporangium rufum]|uniref:Putative zinc-finger domain-containing protein n=1 Tax=Sphaerisporangium rufum TaxID=1381558 RepID=A0A919R710_9ACTN|nr:zf-HC2 domain-containing protein [Sphaerisporangium rufum]GII80433.1 hypothetical protein Sru01_54150 [Sphaerisporangium rufum]